ncbi:MAG TPA: MFS transporter [Acidimicrobiales bacterium]|jgi:EmrB/QacA subfamily drug resistance transporter
MSSQLSVPSLASSDELSRRRRIGILLICSMSLLIVGLDVTIVNVALPSIGREFHAPLSGLQWTIDAYTLVLASLLMLSGSTADRLGRRRTFVIGLVTFGAGSLLCSLAPNLTLLIVFRMVQAVGGSMLNPVAMSIITNTFTNPRERAQAIGVWGAVVGVSMALGPVIGGALVTSVGWRSIFWINIPVALAAAVLAIRYIPESKAAVARKVDIPGQVFVVTLLASLTYGIIEAPNRGWGSPIIVGALALAVASLVGLLVWEHRTSQPLIDLRFFRSAPFSSAAIIAIASFAALGGFLFLNTLYLQDVRGLSPLHAGLDTLPMAVMTMVLSPISGRIVGRRGGRIPLVVAGIALIASCLTLVGLSATTPFTWLFTAYVIFGVGFGFVNAPITNTAVSGMPRSQAGVAAAIASTSRQIGQTLGVAVVGSLVTASLQKGSHVNFAVASRAGWWVLTGCGAVILLLGVVGTSSWAKGTAQRTAELINPEFLEGHAG